MVETIPRRRPLRLLPQVVLAVFSGMAALYCIQNINGTAAWKGFSALEALLKSGVARLQKPPAPAPAPPPETAGLPKPGREAIPAPVASSMLVVPEPGGAPQGMIRAYEDSPERAPGAPKPPPPSYNPQPQPQNPDQAGGRPHLRSVRWKNESLHQEVGAGFARLELKPMSFKKKEAPPVQAPQKPAEAKEAPRLKFYPQLIDKEPLPGKDILTPSPVHPETPEEKPFWTEERVLRVSLSGFLALAGAAYLICASGLIAALKGKSADEPGSGS